MSDKRDATEHPEPERVTAYRAWGIYADYDANAPDTRDLILVSTEALARDVCDALNEDPRRWGNLAFVDGWEFCKSFQHRLALVEDPSCVRRSVAEVFEKDVEDSGDCEDGEEDGD